ncbi:hypothetical protein RFI_13975 [Reticulomyxa filosa]|uniref:Uncharacterized protein n=1 Tax=Reticulomyxa filosa TaxID=46433 RepID=X6NB01_RETFI|nr:hypothetical protein RFI_13975 [Reticulomyxa filosa]|eukprot:ETO23211.1 hypothetical protein RFI_13975 [Reticulomyxa filosa]
MTARPFAKNNNPQARKRSLQIKIKGEKNQMTKKNPTKQDKKSIVLKVEKKNSNKKNTNSYKCYRQHINKTIKLKSFGKGERKTISNQNAMEKQAKKQKNKNKNK